MTASDVESRPLYRRIEADLRVRIWSGSSPRAHESRPSSS
jgi:hypothetical protein